MQDRYYYWTCRIVSDDVVMIVMIASTNKLGGGFGVISILKFYIST